MIRHILTMKLPPMEEEEREEMKQRYKQHLQALEFKQVAGILKQEIWLDDQEWVLGQTNKRHDLLMDSLFANWQALEDFTEHPMYQQLLETCVQGGGQHATVDIVLEEQAYNE